MGNAFWFTWEPGVITFLQSKVTPLLQKLFEAITFFGDEYAMILLVGFLYWGYKKELGRKISTYAITALVTSIALNNLVMRRRPYFDHPEIKCLKPRSSAGDPYDLLVQGYSFPSGHAVDSVSTFAALGLNVGKKLVKVICFTLPILIGLSRLVLGVHYPTDVLAGWLLSALMIFVVSHIQNQNIIYLFLVLVGLAGCFFSRSTDYFSALGLAFWFVSGFVFEEALVHFENTKNVFRMVLRTVGGLVLFVVLDKLMKLPFPEAFLASKTGLSFFVRTVRYTVASFVLIGVYPICFGRFGKVQHIFQKR